uniref:Uncharacterized protein n=1 Tax=Setaria italica TaxID=4555 RepID=K3ZP92_SETIT
MAAKKLMSLVHFTSVCPDSKYFHSPPIPINFWLQVWGPFALPPRPGEIRRELHAHSCLQQPPIALRG